MHRFILILRLIPTIVGIVLLQACYSTAITTNTNESRFPDHSQQQAEVSNEGQKMSVIFPMGQQYEQSNDECWGHDIDVVS
ncbi:hypothetical protein [uncultured Shewanella sp.]|uniref:hypothetical protein n=1 Tax=uncultured Shewanella sp. TaxID=173975 RepID=UPI002614C22F|nr:hypothetical protein [uncultured Shewanella sp.]